LPAEKLNGIVTKAAEWRLWPSEALSSNVNQNAPQESDQHAVLSFSAFHFFIYE
jgi:hypothetical protein